MLIIIVRQLYYENVNTRKWMLRNVVKENNFMKIRLAKFPKSFFFNFISDLYFFSKYVILYQYFII